MGVRRYVIVGGGPAGRAAARAIVRQDPAGRVTLLSDETNPGYARLLLTYWLAGKMTREQLEAGAAGAMEGVELLAGRRAVGIDSGKGRVELEDGRKVPYDRLLVATGAWAQRLAIPGADLAGVCCLRNLGDAEAIARRIRGGGRAIFLGGGLICLQTADALVRRGMEAVLLVRSGAILSQVMDPDTARLLEGQVRRCGVRLVRGVDAVGIQRAGADGLVVTASNGRRFDGDVVVIGKGVRPAAEMAAGSGVATERGILVDERMRTTVEGIYAAGDVAQARHVLTQERTSFGIWPVAAEQGRVAGINMAGGVAEWAGGLNRNVTNLFGWSVGSAGLFGEAEGAEVVGFRDRVRQVVRRLVLREGRCVGAVLVNRTEDLGVFCAAMASGRPIAESAAALVRGEQSGGRTWLGGRGGRRWK